MDERTGKKEMFRSKMFDADEDTGEYKLAKWLDNEGSLMNRQPGEMMILPSQTALAQTAQLREIYEGVDAAGRKILGAAINPVTLAIEDIYYTHEGLPPLMKVTTFKRDGNTIYLARHEGDLVDQPVDPLRPPAAPTTRLHPAPRRRSTAAAPDGGYSPPDVDHPW